MKFYNVTERYIEYLRQYDNRVSKNKKQSRPYIGVLLTVNNVNYFAPLSSPKEKHSHMKNTKDFIKIGDGSLGAINLNNMIPIIESELIPLQFNNEPDSFYRNLLMKQYRLIKANSRMIQETANALYNIIFSDDNCLSNHDMVVKKRCCNLPLLESIYKNYDQHQI